MLKKIFLVCLIIFQCSLVHAEVNAILAIELSNARREGNQEKIHEIAQKIIVNNPQDPLGYGAEADYYFATENYKIAIDYYLIQIEKAKYMEKHGKELMKQQMKQQGVDINDFDTDNLFDFSNTIGKAYNKCGVCYSMLYEYDKALENFYLAEKYIKNYDYLTSVCKLAAILKSTNNYDIALKEARIIKKHARNEKERNTIQNVINYCIEQKKK